MDSILEQPVRARLITADDGELPVPATLRYSRTDPLAVRLAFPPEVCLGGAAVVWTLARALLEQGLRGPAGAGDVRIRPGGPDRTVVELHSSAGLALLRFDTAELNSFLLRTYGVVPDGEEDVAEAIDRGLHALFGTV
ncbi:SsgA family sporulation/cell division regulator [Streptomyces tropicalis]|uniref:SsgA family sporulation/cell division regulator n=1 Tax=Streptomyces tropicalis TaxID=3034234 RepID=A0ABT6AA76_9ACTN|nr:SsgA family sporulation/cell division regulator [Streptomyces tropicalis]MDF3301342.1 SsgA family sporulation/cell division regulator [Streptomyces tropicalis]